MSYTPANERKADGHERAVPGLVWFAYFNEGHAGFTKERGGCLKLNFVLDCKHDGVGVWRDVLA